MVDLAKQIELPDLEIYCKHAIEDVMANCDPTDGTEPWCSSPHVPDFDEDIALKFYLLAHKKVKFDKERTWHTHAFQIHAKVKGI